MGGEAIRRKFLRLWGRQGRCQKCLAIARRDIMLRSRGRKSGHCSKKEEGGEDR